MHADARGDFADLGLVDARQSAKLNYISVRESAEVRKASEPRVARGKSGRKECWTGDRQAKA